MSLRYKIAFFPGAVALCFGALLALQLAAECPETASFNVICPDAFIRCNTNGFWTEKDCDNKGKTGDDLVMGNFGCKYTGEAKTQCQDYVIPVYDECMYEGICDYDKDKKPAPCYVLANSGTWKLKNTKQITNCP